MQNNRHQGRTSAKLSVAIALATGLAACAEGGGSAPETAPADDIPEFDDTIDNEWPFDNSACGAAEYGKKVAGSMLVVLDRSGSMAYRWLETRGAVIQMMSHANPELEVGMLPFPALECDYDGLTTCLSDPSGSGCNSTLNVGCCNDVAAAPPVPLMPALAARDASWEWFQGQEVDGFTPTATALDRAYAYMATQPSEGQRYVVLFTDGQPTLANEDFGVPAFDACGEESGILSSVSSAANATNSVKTFVIGAPGSEVASGLLGEMAIRGGTALKSPCNAGLGECHYTIDEDDYGAKLENVLDTIAGLVGDCTFDIPEGTEKADPAHVNVGIETNDGTSVVYRDPNHNDGWDFADVEKTQVRLYGPACQLYNARAANEVVIVIGCETLVK